MPRDQFDENALFIIFTQKNVLRDKLNLKCWKVLNSFSIMLFDALQNLLPQTFPTIAFSSIQNDIKKTETDKMSRSRGRFKLIFEKPLNLSKARWTLIYFV